MTPSSTETISQQLNLGRTKGKKVIANFDGGRITSDAVILWIAELDKKLKITAKTDKYCPRGEMENRIKEQQLDLFADRTSTQTFESNQLRLWLSSMAYVLMQAFRQHCLSKTSLAKATLGTIRLNLLKLGARITVSVRRILIAFASSCPYQDIIALAYSRIQAIPDTG